MRNVLRGFAAAGGAACSERRSGRVTILDVVGDITFGGGTGALRRETCRLIAEGRPARVIV